jgi:hypothetical protein
MAVSGIWLIRAWNACGSGMGDIWPFRTKRPPLVFSMRSGHKQIHSGHCLRYRQQTISPARTSKDTFFDGIVFMQFRRTVTCSTLSTTSPGVISILSTSNLIWRRPSCGQFFFACLGDIDRTDAFALAQDGAAIGDFHDFIEFMGDEENRLAFGDRPRMIPSVL